MTHRALRSTDNSAETANRSSLLRASRILLCSAMVWNPVRLVASLNARMRLRASTASVLNSVFTTLSWVRYGPSICAGRYALQPVVNNKFFEHRPRNPQTALPSLVPANQFRRSQVEYSRNISEPADHRVLRHLQVVGDVSDCEQFGHKWKTPVTPLRGNGTGVVGIQGCFAVTIWKLVAEIVESAKIRLPTLPALRPLPMQ